MMHALRFLESFFIVAKFAQKTPKNQQRVKTPFFSLAQWHHVYMQKQHVRGATVQVDSPHTTSDSAEH